MLISEIHLFRCLRMNLQSEDIGVLHRMDGYAIYKMMWVDGKKKLHGLYRRHGKLWFGEFYEK